ncbi:MAG: CAP domain-containing protein, partial [Nitrososphaera sp.]
MSVILVTAAILTVQSSSSSLSMLQKSYAQLCPDGSTPDARGNCATMPPPPPAGDGETAQAPPPATTETPPPPATQAPPANASQVSNNTGGMSADWINSILAVHNSERAAVGVPPLVWSNSLAAGAQAWAEHVSQTGIVAHSTCCGAFRDYGESIAGFYWDQGPTAPGTGTSLMVAEKSNYVPGTPINSGTIGPNGGVYGHYTQMVWRNTQEVGC